MSDKVVKSRIQMIWEAMQYMAFYRRLGLYETMEIKWPYQKRHS